MPIGGLRGFKTDTSLQQVIVGFDQSNSWPQVHAVIKTVILLAPVALLSYENLNQSLSQLTKS